MTTPSLAPLQVKVGLLSTAWLSTAGLVLGVTSRVGVPGAPGSRALFALVGSAALVVWSVIRHDRRYKKAVRKARRVARKALR